MKGETTRKIICIACPKGCHLAVEQAPPHKVTGHTCPRGEAYGREELLRPTRTLTSTVCTESPLYPRCSVRTSAPIPKEKIEEAMHTLNRLCVALPVGMGQVLVEDFLGTGADLIATRTLPPLG